MENNIRVVAEIGCNHCGSLDTAKEMIQVAKEFCKVDAVKFQKRCINECLSPDEYNKPHPVPYNSYGDSYGLHREALEFDLEQHTTLKDYCEQQGIEYTCSVWDLTSAQEIASLKPKSIKLPSACNSNPQLLEFLCTEYSGQIDISLGMTNRAEESDIIEHLARHGRIKDTVIYSCTSGYPVADEDVCLLEIQRIKNLYSDNIKAVGFSGHHNGIAIDMAAYALGARVFERHFTLNRTWKGTDHAASLEPDGMRKLARDLISIQKSMTYKNEEVLPVEAIQRAKLKWNRKQEEHVGI